MAAELAHLALMRGSTGERARALLEPLQRVVRFDAGFLTLLAPAGGRHESLLTWRHDDATRRYLSSAEYYADVEAAGVDRSRRPLRAVDMPVPPTELPIWANLLYPAGFREGIGVPLTTIDGRYLGLLALITEAAQPADPAVCVDLARVAPLIAQAVDPLRTIGMMAAIVTDAVAGVVVARDGRTVAVPGLPDHALLATGSPVLGAAGARLAQGPAHAAFLCPDPSADAAPDWVRITALACPPQPPGNLCALVLMSPAPHLHGLTRRELEILGLLVEGWSNAQIAAALFITTRTVAAHVEHVMVKLTADSRTMAATRALRHGLYVPAELKTAPE